MRAIKLLFFVAILLMVCAYPVWAQVNAADDPNLDPDELAPVSEPVGDVVDEIDYSGPLPPFAREKDFPLVALTPVGVLVVLGGMVLRRR